MDTDQSDSVGGEDQVGPTSSSADEPPSPPGTPPTGAAGAAGSPPPAASRRHPTLIIGLVLTAALVVGAVVSAVVLVTSGGRDPFSPGSGSATITWTSVGGVDDGSAPPPQPFGGTIDGVSVSGVAKQNTQALTRPGSPSSLGLPTRFRIFDYSGTFDGESFTLGVYIAYSNPVSSGAAPRTGTVTVPSIEVLGSYGSEPVHARLALPPSAVTAPRASANTPIPFSGTVGGHQVTGEIHYPTTSGSRHAVTATFTVTH